MPWNVCQDKKPVNKKPLDTQDEAFGFLLRWQGQSVDYAIKHGGYTIEEVDGCAACHEMWRTRIGKPRPDMGPCLHQVRERR